MPSRTPLALETLNSLSDISCHPVFRQFRAYILTECRLSSHTWTSYLSDLKSLLLFSSLSESSLPTLTFLVSRDPKFFRSFLAQRHTAEVSARSLRRTLSALKTFFTFFVIAACAQIRRPIVLIALRFCVLPSCHACYPSLWRRKQPLLFYRSRMTRGKGRVIKLCSSCFMGRVCVFMKLSR